MSFWAPFSVTSVFQSKDVYTGPQRIVKKWGAPALWQVSGPVAAEAHDYMFNERMRLVFTSLPMMTSSEMHCRLFTST